MVSECYNVTPCLQCFQLETLVFPVGNIGEVMVLARDMGITIKCNDITRL